MLRIALFSDFYYEENTVAQTVRAVEARAKHRNIAMLSVHGGPETLLVHDGSIVRFDLKRSSWRFDLAMRRYAPRVAAALQWFAPDVLHVTGGGDIERLGMHLGHRLNCPIVHGVEIDAFEAALDAGWWPRTRCSSHPPQECST